MLSPFHHMQAMQALNAAAAAGAGGSAVREGDGVRQPEFHSPLELRGSAQL